MADTEIKTPTKNNEFEELPEGIMGVTDNYGRTFTRALSNTSIEVLDLISEGEIDGLVKGTYEYTVDEPYQIGYSTAIFKPYPNAPNTDINWFRSVFWNEIPVMSIDNKFNFQNIDVSFTPGLPNGSIINRVFPQTTISRTIGERFRASEIDTNGQPILNSDHVKTYRILNKECIGVYINIRIQALQETLMKQDSDIVATEVKYSIYYRPIYYSATNISPQNYIFVKEVKISGKVQQGFIKTDRVDFFTNQNIVSDQNFQGWEIKLARTTPESLSSLLRNTTFVDSITEIYGTIFTYPNSAIVRSRFNAEYFSQVPDRYFHARLLKVYIPNTYDPITRTYNDVIMPWQGLFKPDKAWTNNPAWCFYDMLTNPNYGLGNYILHKQVDKWTLYDIAKYCDVMVPDGYGGYEPRFECNLILNNREEAYNVVNNLASTFRGLTYFGHGLIYAIQDAPKDSIITFTNSNVADGNFNYASSSKRVRHTVAVVRYNDKRNFYKPAIEYVEDVDAIRKYGIRELEIDAVGCTSRGQAIRFGRWALLSETLETETVSFTTGPDLGMYLRPGDVFTVIDNNKKMSRYAGRIQRYTYDNVTNRTTIVLDDVPTLNAGVNYVLNLVTPSFNYDGGKVTNLTSNDINNIRRGFIQKVEFEANANTVNSSNYLTTLTFNGKPIDDNNYNVPDYTVWSIYMNSGINNYEYNSNFIDGLNDNYRVINIEEKENQYNIIGLQYNPQKYVEIESGLNFDRYNETITFPTPPIASYSQELTTSVSSRRIQLNWMQPTDYYTTNTAIFVGRTDDVNFTLNSVPSSDYLVGMFSPDTQQFVYEPKETGNFVYSIWTYDQKSNLYSSTPTSGTFSINEINPIKDYVLNGLSLVSGDSDDITLSPEANPIFTWQMGNTGQSILNNAFYRLTIREPSTSGTPTNTVYYEYTNQPVFNFNLRHLFPFEDNLNAVGGPYRKYDVVVEAIDNIGRTSAGNWINFTSGIYDETWSNSYGYDILNIDNSRITGLYLSTTNEIENNGFITRQFIDPALNINLKFISGDIPSKLVGAYIYFSTGIFSGENLTGASPVISNNNIFVGKTLYNSTIRSMFCPLYYEGLYLNESGYLALAPIDIFDNEVINKYNPNLITGLPITNIVPIQFSGHTNHLSIGNNVTFYQHSNQDNRWKIHSSMISGRKVLINTEMGSSDAIISSEID